MPFNTISLSVHPVHIMSMLKIQYCFGMKRLKFIFDGSKSSYVLHEDNTNLYNYITDFYQKIVNALKLQLPLSFFKSERDFTYFRKQKQSYENAFILVPFNIKGNKKEFESTSSKEFKSKSSLKSNNGENFHMECLCILQKIFLAVSNLRGYAFNVDKKTDGQNQLEQLNRYCISNREIKELFFSNSYEPDNTFHSTNVDIPEDEDVFWLLDYFYESLIARDKPLEEHLLKLISEKKSMTFKKHVLVEKIDPFVYPIFSVYSLIPDEEAKTEAIEKRLELFEVFMNGRSVNTNPLYKERVIEELDNFLPFFNCFFKTGMLYYIDDANSYFGWRFQIMREKIKGGCGFQPVQTIIGHLKIKQESGEIVFKIK